MQMLYRLLYNRVVTCIKFSYAIVNGFRLNRNALQVYKIPVEESAISSLENSIVTRLVIKDIT